jgi:hypothetical protein
MNVRKSLEKRIRGWLPKESKLSSPNIPIQKSIKPKPLPKRKVTIWQFIAINLVVDFFSFSVLYQLSTVQIVLTIVTGALAITWAVFSRMPHPKINKPLKYTLVLVFIFVVTFFCTGFFFYFTSGYPPSNTPQIIYPNILDAPLTQYLNGVEQSGSFRFLQVQHLGSVTFGGLTLSTSYSNAPGGLDWTFFAGDVKTKIIIHGYSEKTYSTFPAITLTRTYYQALPSPRSIKESFDQIAARGLRWYYDQAVKVFQNRTGAEPTITDLRVNIAASTLNVYDGVTIVIIGYHITGPNIFGYVFKAEFQPDGTLLSYSPGIA